jgi:hypothetical protein
MIIKNDSKKGQQEGKLKTQKKHTKLLGSHHFDHSAPVRPYVHTPSKPKIET